MGLLYSITSYFYPTNNPAITEAAIKSKAQRLILCCQQAQYKLQQASIKEE